MKAVSARSASLARGVSLLDDVAVAIRDALDVEGLHPKALVGEGGVGGHHLLEGGLARPEGDRQVGRKLAGEAEAAGVLDALLDPHRLQGLHRRDVAALLDRPPQGDRPHVRPVVVLGGPGRLVPGVREGEGRVHDDGRGRPAERLEGRGVDDRLERGAHLAHRLRRPVELASLEVVAPDEGAHRPRPDVHGEERPLDLRLLLQLDRRFLAPVGLRERHDPEGRHGAPGKGLGHGGAPGPGDVRRARAARGSRRSARRRRPGRRRSRRPAPRRPPRTASPTRRGAGAPGAARPRAPSPPAERSRARGGRARAARCRPPSPPPAAGPGRGWCGPAAPPGRSAGCRTPAPGTCAPPRGSAAPPRAAPGAAGAPAAPPSPPPPPRGSRTSPRPCGRGRGCAGRAPARGSGPERGGERSGAPRRRGRPRPG